MSAAILLGRERRNYGIEVGLPLVDGGLGVDILRLCERDWALIKSLAVHGLDGMCGALDVCAALRFEAWGLGRVALQTTVSMFGLSGAVEVVDQWHNKFGSLDGFDAASMRASEQEIFDGTRAAEIRRFLRGAEVFDAEGMKFVAEFDPDYRRRRDTRI